MTQILTYTPNEGPGWTVEGALDVTNKDLPNGVEGQSFSHQFNAVNGTGPYVFSSGAWPTGITMDANGLVSGTSPAAGTYTLPVVQVQSA